MSKFDALKGAAKSQSSKGTAGVASNTKGKSSDDDYKQASVYVRKDTHKLVTKALVDEDYDFSDLVQSLLDGWLKERT